MALGCHVNPRVVNAGPRRGGHNGGAFGMRAADRVMAKACARSVVSKLKPMIRSDSDSTQQSGNRGAFVSSLVCFARAWISSDTIFLRHRLQVGRAAALQ